MFVDRLKLWGGYLTAYSMILLTGDGQGAGLEDRM